MAKKTLINKEELREALGLKGFIGRLTSGILYHILGLDSLNGYYGDVSGLYGPTFSEGVLKEMGIKYEALPEQEGYIPAEGGFITVSNHPFGGAEGLILNAIVGSKRSDFKILTTFLLAKIRNLAYWFIPVDNFSTGGTKSISGIREALDHLASGHPLGLFPAGEVSTWQKKGQRTAISGKRVVEDKPWADNIIKIIKNSGLPVVPVYFDGANSNRFHTLGRIHPMLRTVRLARELMNKKGTTVKVRIGKPVSPEDIANLEIKELGKYLRNRCYALEAQCSLPSRNVSNIGLNEIAPPVDPELVRAQMKKLEDKILFETGDYRVYLIGSSDAPLAMRELYRLREETFRAIGEGTGNPLDTDSYDAYYKHLILWNIPNGDIVGSYRVGYGAEIIPKLGIDGLYTSSLLKYGPAAEEILAHSMELGRSFISLKYQREVLPLKLMLAGLTVALVKDPKTDCSIGTVSISDSLPDFYKSLGVYFLERDFKLPEAELFATPPHPFESDFLRVDPEPLLSQIPRGNLDAFDKFLSTLADGNYRLPVLFRKYFNCGARVACFNVDPLFNYSLDGMIVLRMKDFPLPMIRSIVRPLPKEMQEAVFMRCYGTVNPE